MFRPNLANCAPLRAYLHICKNEIWSDRKLTFDSTLPTQCLNSSTAVHYNDANIKYIHNTLFILWSVWNFINTFIVYAERKKNPVHSTSWQTFTSLSVCVCVSVLIHRRSMNTFRLYFWILCTILNCFLWFCCRCRRRRSRKRNVWDYFCHTHTLTMLLGRIILVVAFIGWSTIHQSVDTWATKILLLFSLSFSY